MILLDGDGRVTAAVEDATPRGVPAAVVVKIVATAARAVAAGAGVELRHLGGVGMAVPGRVDSARGLLRFAPIFPGGATCRWQRSPPRCLRRRWRWNTMCAWPPSASRAAALAPGRGASCA